VYTFLDDAPLEERRTQAVYTRRATEPRHADDLGALDPLAIQRVREEAWPYAKTPDELHDALMLAGFLREDEVLRARADVESAAGDAEEAQWPRLMDELVAEGRAVKAAGFWVAIERFEELNAVIGFDEQPAIPERIRKQWTREDAIRELVRGRTEVLGPVTAVKLAASLSLDDSRVVNGALLELETEGRLLRGYFSPKIRPHLAPADGEKNASGTVVEPTVGGDLEWCDRRLLARIHRYTINRLRAEIEAVNAADFMRFLLHWQHVAPEQQVSGVEGLAAVVEQLDGYELAAAAWEHDVLPARVRDYTSSYVDMLCLSGRVAWGRTTPMDGAAKAPLKSSPIALLVREHAALWRASSGTDTDALSSGARAVHDALQTRGASFFHELVAATGMLRTHVESALGELAGTGLVTADSFSGLRALLTPSQKRKSLSGGRPSARRSAYGVDTAGRWALFTGEAIEGETRVEAIARALLKRYGVVFRSLLVRESRLPTWRELVMVYRRLEARGEIRGGRFVSGFGGEQFALPDAVGRMRAVRKLEKSGELIIVSGADPLNLVGILTPDDRVTAIARNRVLFRDGVAIGAWEGGEVRRLGASELDDETLHSLLARRASVKWLRPHFRTATERERQMLARKRDMDLKDVTPGETIH
jgi:ATP-dependent Lhr-like helicase